LTLPTENGFSHLDAHNRPGMVDVGSKDITHRKATARAVIWLPPAVREGLRGNRQELHGPKGPVLQTAILAGTMAVKRTSELIPLCHPIPIDACRFEIIDTKDAKGDKGENDDCLELRCTVEAIYRTGVEMEALTGVTIAALTVYDMCKALSHAIEIRAIALVEKTGGRTDQR
jgi:cyclic pyranopterin phosphate synthase